MSATLYTNPKGTKITRHSYSAGSDFTKCRRYYKLKRIDGWKEKSRKAAMDFGTCLETGLRFYHSNACQPGSMAQEFVRMWAAFKDMPNLDWGNDFDWNDLNEIGQQMGGLYEAVLPTLPIQVRADRFQLEFSKPLFPGTYLDGLTDLAYVDMLAEYKWKDGEHTETLARVPVIVDIKTTGASYDATPGIHRLDPQLRRYAWLSGIPNVAFLVFVKTSLGVKKGDKVTLLSPIGQYPAGTRLVVLFAEKDVPAYDLITPEQYTAYQEKSKDLKGKAADLVRMAAGADSIQAPKAEVTKQKLQWLPAYIDEESMKETGEMVGEQIARIVDAGQRNYYPKEGGTRFPTATCTYCPFRGNCLGDKALQDELVVCSKQAPVADKPVELVTAADWLEELGGEVE